MLQADVGGQLPRSDGFSYILTGMDVFTKNMFAQTISSISSEIACKYLMQLFKRHPDISAYILKDKGSHFTSKTLDKFSTLLEFLSEHETLKPPRTIEVVVRSDTSLKRYLKSF